MHRPWLRLGRHPKEVAAGVGLSRAPVLKDVVITEVNDMLARGRAVGPGTRRSPATCVRFCGTAASASASVTLGEVRAAMGTGY